MPTPSRLGMINGSGDADALFLKQFGGEVLTAFAEVTVAPAKQVSGGSDGALGINIATAAITGIGGYMKSNGYTF